MEVLKDLIKTCADVPVRDVFVGYFDTVVLSKRCAIATTMKVPCDGKSGQIRNAGKFAGMRAAELAEFLLSENVLEASIGMAALNSAIPEIPEKEFTAVNAAEIIEERGRGKTVAVIGDFPFAKKLRKTAKRLFVFDQNTRKGVLPAEEERRLLPEADVVAITGTSLINHTFEGLISNIRKDAYKVLLGPSVPLSSVLFDYGIDAVSGTIVDDEEVLLRCLRQASSFRYLSGKRLVTVFKSR